MRVMVKMPTLKHTPEHSDCTTYQVNIRQCLKCGDAYGDDFGRCPWCAANEQKEPKSVTFRIRGRAVNSDPWGFSDITLFKCWTCFCYVESPDYYAHRIRCASLSPTVVK